MTEPLDSGTPIHVELLDIIMPFRTEIASLRAENVALRNEIRRLKGLPPRPTLKPSGMEQSPKRSSAAAARAVRRPMQSSSPWPAPNARRTLSQVLGRKHQARSSPSWRAAAQQLRRGGARAAAIVAACSRPCDGFPIRMRYLFRAASHRNRSMICQLRGVQGGLLERKVAGTHDDRQRNTAQHPGGRRP
jgi:hypothetical protein